MNKRFSMLPGGGLYERYKWWRFRCSLREFEMSMRELGKAAEGAIEAMRKFSEAFSTIASPS